MAQRRKATRRLAKPRAIEGGATAKPRAPAVDKDPGALVDAPGVRALLGDKSEMHLWRLIWHHLHPDEVEQSELRKRYAALCFPAPLKINGRNYFRYGEVMDWIDKHEAPAVAA
jgi:hypothetical protein